MFRRILPFITGFLLLTGCSGAVHHVPRLSQQEISAAETDVLAEPNLESRRDMSVLESRQALGTVIRRVHPVAQQLCREVQHGTCYWRYAMSRDRDLNAFATLDGYVVIHRGVVELTASDDEIALVLAHELGHQLAGHPVSTRRNAAIGGLIGVMLGTAADAASARGGVYTGGYYGQVGSAVGQSIGALSYSKEQEREADYLGVVIAHRAGYDLDKARNVMITLARMGGKRQAGALDSHPMGAERLAGFDRAVAEVRASNGQLPPRAK